MTEMIERVARALYAQANWNGMNSESDKVKLYFNELNNERKSKYRKQAEASIRAMKVPTDEMLEPVTNADGFFKVSDPKQAYQTMIEAALT